MVKEFTDFPNVGIMQPGDLPVGTRAGQNAQFDFPGTGIQDIYGNFLIGWGTVGASAANYIQSINAVSGQSPGFTTAGMDANIGINFSPKGNGGIGFNTSDGANFSYVNSGVGNVTFYFGGYFSLNGTQGIRGISNDSTLDADSATLIPTQKAVKDYIASSTSPPDATYITNTDETADLPNSQPLSALTSGFATVAVATGIIGTRVHTGTANQITVTNGDGAAANPTYSLPENLIAPGTFRATTSINIGGGGATVTSISTDGTLSADSDTLLVTEKAAKTYIDGTQALIKAATYITNTNETALLPNSQSLSSLATGIVGVTTATGLLSSVTLTGTSNQVSITNGAGGGNPTFSLSSTLATPGTFAVGMGGVTVTTISNSATASGDVLMNADAIQTAISSQVGSAKSFRGGYDASSNLFPTTGGSGVAGAVQAGDVWSVTVPGTLGGTAVSNGDTILALVDTPGQTAANWSINSNGVATWNGRAGIVVPVLGDYSFSLISGTAAATQGGTGQTSYTIGDLLYASSASALSKLADVATGNVLLSGGVATAPSWGKVDLTAAVTGILPTANGGTGNGSGQAASVANAATFNNSGSGAASGTTFDGSVVRTVSYNTVGASPLAGSSSIVTVGTITSGIWQGTAISEVYGGTNQTSYTKGDLLHASATNTLSKLGVGSTGQVLTVVGGDTAWVTPIIPSSYGTLRWANAETGGAFAFTTTPTEMNNIASISYAISGSSSDFSLSGTGRLQYTGATTKKFVVRGGLSWAELAYGVNIQLYQNGSPIGNSIYTAGGNNNTPSYVITLAQNQYISLYGWRVAVSLTIISAWISVTEFST